MSEIRTNLTVSGESSEYRGNISISVVTLNSNLVDTQSSFRTNIEVSLNIENDTISSIKTDLELNNVSLDFYLVDMTKLNQSILYFSKFFNMNFEPELIWEMLAQGTNEQINASHLSDALSKYVSVDSLTNVYNSITNLGNTINGHINNNIVHLTDEEKYFLNSIMTNPPWSTGTAGLFEYINVGDNNNVIWAVRPLLNAGKDVGIISNTFISCRGVDATAGGSGGGITRQDLFYILKGEPQDSSEYINSKYLRLDDILDDYATEEWVNNTFIKEEKDPTVPSHVKKITQDQIYSWDLVASLFSVSEDDTYVLVNDNRGFVSTSFLSCKGLDVSAANSGSGIDMSLVWYYLGLDGNEQINKSHITTALNGYATEDWVSSNYVLGSTYTNQIQTINTNISKKADKTLTITAGNGLTGGGTLEENRTITLGNPSTITDETDNTVSEESHTHKINKASTTVIGIVKLYDALDSNSNILALTANQGKILGDRVILLEDMWENKNTYLLAKKDRGIVSNSFISVKGLDTSAPQTGGNFDRSSLFSILSSSPQSGEYINIEYLDLSDYATKSDLTSKISLDEADKRYVLLTSFTTLNNKVNDFLEGSDTDNIINKWKELEAFLEGQTETSTLSDLLSYKLDTSVYNTFIGTLGTAAYKEADDFLVSTTKYAIADDVGGNALNALNANKLGEQEPTYYAKASDLQLLLNVIGIDENGDVYIKKNGEVARNFWTYGAISFGGVGTGGGGSTGGVTALSALSDVALGTLSDGQALVWDSSSLKWVNKSVAASGEYLPLNGGVIDGKTNDVPLTIKSNGGTTWLQIIPRDGISRYIGVDVENGLKYQYSATSYYIIHSGNIGSYNAGSATKLNDNTAYTAWGQTFFQNGVPQNVGGELSDVTRLLLRDGGGSGIYRGNNYSSSYAKTDMAYHATIHRFFGGNVLIGTTTDNGQKLQVEGTIGLRNNAIFNYGGEGIYVDRGGVYWHNSSNEWTKNLLTFYSSGNVRIGDGEDDGTYKLQINGGFIASSGYVSSTSINPFAINSSNSEQTYILVKNNNNGKAAFGWRDGYGAFLYNNTKNSFLGINDDNVPYFSYTTNRYTLYHTGNFNPANYLPTSGGTITGQVYIVMDRPEIDFYKGSGNSVAIMGYRDDYGAWLYNDKSGSYLNVTDSGIGTFNGNTLIHSSNIGEQSVKYATTSNGMDNVGVANLTNARLQFWWDWGENAITGYGGAYKYGLHIGSPDPNYYFQVGISTAYNGLYGRFKSAGTWNSWREIAFTDSNVASATKLQTARNLWGNSFDGTSNVGGYIWMNSGGEGIYLSNSGISWHDSSNAWAFSHLEFTNSGYTRINPYGGQVLVGTTNDSGARVSIADSVSITKPLTSSDWSALSLHYTGPWSQYTNYIAGVTVTDGEGVVGKFGVTFNGVGKFSIRGLYYGGYNGSGEVFSVDGSGKTSISGNFIAAGAITFGSDARYKHRLNDVSISLDDIANAPLFNYVWNDREDKKVHLGTTAQYWNNTAFKNAVCPTTDEKLWTMSYSEIAMGNTIVIARELIPIKSDVQILKERVDKLESILRSNNIKFD